MLFRASSRNQFTAISMSGSRNSKGTFIDFYRRFFGHFHFYNHGPTFSIRLSGSSLSGCARQRHPIAFQSFQYNSPFSFLDFASFLFTFFSCTLGVQACTTGRRSVLPAFSLCRPQGGSDLRCFPICRSVASRVHSRFLRGSARSRCAARRRRLAGSGPPLSSAVACELSKIEIQLYYS